MLADTRPRSLIVLTTLLAAAALAALAAGSSAAAGIAMAGTILASLALLFLFVRRDPAAGGGGDRMAAVGGETGRLSEAQRRLFDQIPDPLLQVGPNRVVIAANQAAEALFGRGLDDRDLAHVLRQPEVLEAAEAVLAGEPGREVQIQLAGSAERHFAVRVQPLAQAGALILLHETT